MNETMQTGSAPEAEGDQSDTRAADGRVPGRRGLATRQRLLDCTARMLDAHSYRELKVVDIAREAGTSPATFYQYFPDVSTAILVLAEQMASTGEDQLLGPLDRGSWSGDEARRTSDAIAEAFLAFWREHGALMGVMDLAALEGDVEFRRIRTRLLHRFTKRLAAEVRVAQQEGRHPADLDPMATAGVLVSMLSHVAAHAWGFEYFGMSENDLRRSMARIVFAAVTGARPDGG